MIDLIAQSEPFFRDRSGGGDCVERNGFCPRWIVDHLDRYTTPFLEHLELVVISVSVASRSRCSSAKYCAIPPPIDRPTTWARTMPRPSSTATASLTRCAPV